MGDSEQHHHSTTPPGWSDIILGALAFLAVSEGTYHLIGAIKPGLFTAETLLEMRLCGGLFFVLWATLGKQVFEPFFESAIAREEATVGASSNAGELRSRVLELESELEEKLRESRLEGIRNRDAQVDIAKKEAAGLLDEAKSKNEAELAQANEKLAALKVEAEAELALQADELKRLVVDKVLAQSRALH